MKIWIIRLQMMFIMAALQLNQKSGYDTLKIFLCGLDKGPIIE